MESNPVVAEAIKVLSAKISSLKTELNALTNQRENQVILWLFYLWLGPKAHT